MDDARTHHLLRQLIELTEREAALIESADSEGLHLVCDVRAMLLDSLGALPASAQSLVERFEGLRDANERRAGEKLDELRRELARVGGGRRAVSAYAPVPARGVPSADDGGGWAG